MKLSNLQNMTKTLSYVQEHGYDTAEDAEDRLAEIKELATYEAAIKFLKEKAGGGKLPALQTLKAEKEKLLVQKKNHRRNIIITVITRKNWILYVPISMLHWDR